MPTPTLESDVSLLKSSIKSWEREFKAQYGRMPTREDIRAQPEIDAKYASYKALKSTAGRTSSLSSVVDAPRQINEPGPLPTFNPFSPTKKHQSSPRKSGNIASTSYLPLSPTKQSNPFASPARPKRAPSYETNVFKQLEQTTRATLQDMDVDEDTSMDDPHTISRAKKRLRGDPVSPSPTKKNAKRARVQLFPKKDPFVSSDEEDKIGLGEAQLAFVVETPARPSRTADGKQFRPLFDEADLGPPPNPAILQPVKRPPKTLRALMNSTASDDDDETSKPTTLIPPSPVVTNGRVKTTQSKSRFKSSKGKAAVHDDDPDLSDDEDEPIVRVVKSTRHTMTIPTGMDDDDPILYNYINKSRRPLSPPPDEGEMIVDIPEHLRQVVFLKSWVNQEEQDAALVKDLLAGKRKIDAGEVWGVGDEQDDTLKELGDEDGWEGEPIAWDGEL